jgi:4-methyl-5(b-hydroxyethyl)-thiazole monophosphate biosynthesis
MSSFAKRVLVPIADDSEEIETTCITDTLTRFGAEVVVASVKPGGELLCKMSRGIKVCNASEYLFECEFLRNECI